MSETAPEEIPTVSYQDPDTGEVHTRPMTEDEIARMRKEETVDTLRTQADEAIAYLDARIDLCLLFMGNPAPTPEQTAEQIKVLSDLSAYSAGTLKRLIVVLGELTRRPVGLW
ncbi:hypothetical protein BI024_gp48 [Streptomyces phage Nanodon]|uniref:Tail assembly chaperone n=1 Tax=Streptomyces phage Nanodon TaxID=1873777 RepID=A0A1B1PA66_9CAUD|nr:hypothetical protein BI024_gp48 [Streptomyces phage Nanodon]ANT41052.1 hypothetical protein SEA_NANODON_48 [Streptomyces phage Nanodon]